MTLRGAQPEMTLHGAQPAMILRADRELRIAGRACAGLLLTLFVVFLVAPVVVVVLMSFTDQLYLAFPPTRLVLRWYYVVAGQERWLRAAWNSIQIGAATATASVILGTLSALAVTRGARPWLVPVGSLIVAPMMLPHIIIAIGLYPTMLDLGLASSYTAVVIGHTVVATPWCSSPSPPPCAATITRWSWRR